MIFPKNSRFDPKFFFYSQFFDPKKYNLGSVGRWRFNKTLNINIHSGIQVLTVQDFLGIIDALMIFRFYYKHLPLDNIDDFSNKRVRLVGELLQEQIRVGLLRIEKTVKYNFANKLKDSV